MRDFTHLAHTKNLKKVNRVNLDIKGRKNLGQCGSNYLSLLPSLHKIRSFSLRSSSVNVTKSAGNIFLENFDFNLSSICTESCFEL